MQKYFQALMIALLIALPTQAAEVVLTDGSKLVGEIKQLADGNIVVTTQTMGEVKVKAEHIAGITSDKPLMVKTATGEVIKGPMKYTQEGGQTVTSEAAGEVKVEPKAVKSVWQPGAEDPEVVAANKAKEAATPKWTIRVLAGVNGQTGNTEKLDLNGRLELRMDASTDRFLAYFQGRYSKENGVRSTNELIGGARYERDITDRLFAFGRIELEFDEFENIDIRVTAAAGVGYFVIREPDQELKVRIGVGYRHESFDTGLTTNDPLLELGANYKKEIQPWLLFTFDTVYNPSLDDFGNFRWTTETGGEIPLSSDKMWKLRLGVRTEYASEPVAGNDELDVYYFANIVVDID